MLYSRVHFLSRLSFKWMWAPFVGGKYKFFFWLLLKDKFNTQNLLRRKNRHLDDYTCVLCQQNVKETLIHLFFSYPFSKQSCQILGIFWDVSLAEMEMIALARHNFGSHIFREIAILVAWCIRTHRNLIIFDGGVLSFDRWKHAFKDEFGLSLHRAKPSLKELDTWFCNNF